MAEAKAAAAEVTRRAFEAYDADHDGRLSFDEFREIVASDYLLSSWFQLQQTALADDAADADAHGGARQDGGCGACAAAPAADDAGLEA